MVKIFLYKEGLLSRQDQMPSEVGPARILFSFITTEWCHELRRSLVSVIWLTLFFCSGN